MYAVFKTGGKQYRATTGDVIKVEKIEAEKGATVELDQVLMVGEGADVKVGNLAAEQFALILAALGVVFVLLRWITETSLVKYGLFVGLISAAAVTYGAFGTMKDEGLEMPSTDDFKPSGDS